MKIFPENSCRLCSKTFCCPQCRSHHEEKAHNVNPDCEICIYGRTTIKTASVSLLSHIRSAHWPLHCVFCKKVFTSLDELVPHDKCTLKPDIIKMQGTPKTPVTPVTEKAEPSPEVTPFYKIMKSGTQQIGCTSISMAVTSTPLIYKAETDTCDKITPIDHSQISCPHKSSLKLTGSSNLSDSKKSDRRVTFSETPSVSEPSKKPKYLPLTTDIEDERENAAEDNSTDDSWASGEEEIFKTAPTTMDLEEKENIDNEVIVLDKFNSGRSLWDTALTRLDCNGSSCSASATNSLNVSLQINVFNGTVSDESSNKSLDEAVKSTNIWSSMTNMVKSVVSNISMTAQNSFSGVSIKRLQSDNDAAEAPRVKRMKLTDLKCRRPIRDLSPIYHIRFAKPRYVDKATQTDECWM